MLLDCWELIQSTSEYDVACHLLYVVVDLRCIPELHCCLSVSSLHPPSVIIFFARKGPYSCYFPSQPFLDGICLNQLNLIYFFPRQSNLIKTFTIKKMQNLHICSAGNPPFMHVLTKKHLLQELGNVTFWGPSNICWILYPQ